MRSKRINAQAVIAIVGPTSSGKSGVAVRLARRFGGEVISADSRQVYAGLDIATGKITKKEMMGVPHHLLGVCDPRRTFTAARYKRLARAAIRDIFARKKLPIVCGGTGFYVDAAIDGTVFPEVKPNAKLRKELAGKSVSELADMLKNIDPGRFETIDARNPRRLVRAIEVAGALGSVPEPHKDPLPVPTLFIGVSPEPATLERNIEVRTHARMRRGMIAEAKRIRKEGVSLARMRELGLEYSILADHLEGKITKEEAERRIIAGDRKYAKRQMTWFKRDKRIRWFDPSDYGRIEKAVRGFLMD